MREIPNGFPNGRAGLREIPNGFPNGRAGLREKCIIKTLSRLYVYYMSIVVLY